MVERFIRTLKTECTRRLLVPYRRDDFRRELTLYTGWYNEHRPHDLHGPVTLNEIFYGRKPASCRPRFEPRRHWPRGSPCAGTQAPIRGRRGQRLELSVRFLSGRRHLPVFELKRAA